MIGGSFVGVVGALLVVLGLLALALKLVQRANGGPLPASRGVALNVVKRVSVGPRQGVALLQVADRLLVVSIAESGTRLLVELDDEALVATLKSGDAPVSTPGTGWRWPAWPMRLGAILLLALLPVTHAHAAPASATATPVPATARPAARSNAPLINTPAVQSSGITSPAPSRTARADTRSVPAAGLHIEGPVPPQVSIQLGQGSDALHLSGAVGIVVFLGMLTLLPALFLLMTSFTRILIVLHFLRSALGTQTTPPSQLLVAVAVLLTGVVMNPALQRANREALQPYFSGQIAQVEAYQRGVKPFREFMLANTREQDLGMFTEMSGIKDATSVDDLPIVTVVSAFVTSELRTAFQMGFVIYLPFVVVDLIVASVLMSMGMFMLPPLMISMPLKLLLFVLADGWTLVVQNLVSSFHQ